ncbi:MAG: NAD-dependent epimerase/dehydratase family protein [Sulfurimonas sp.]|nr:NAD-dependent epimerase/dehydratase family protein [Sulfurimonas sp.]MBU3938892.1 NAD-dependent epimerase/dehydratase family protein [bacterium]MBU4024259.1 NAD-dependent epimerase/dehydratase family protein [bacterium]MBU4111134.1 NAD-dependent epimerase/dehydratase family protein [bacterium]
MTKILITGTAGFIGFHLAKKLLERGDEVVGLDNINDYYDVNLKYARLAELGISRHPELDSGSLIQSSTYPNHKFIKVNLEDAQTINKLFETEDRPIKVFNHGNMSRDFTYIDDIVVPFFERLAA